MSVSRRRALAFCALVTVAAVPAGTALAASENTTRSDVASLAAAESSMLTVLKAYESTATWKAQFRAAELAQASAIAKVDTDLSPPQSPRPVGTTASLTTMSGVPVTVTLNRVIDPAKASSSETPLPNTRFVAAEFTVTDRSAARPLSDSADNNASVVGSDNQTYASFIAEVSGCTNFDNGQYRLGPGETATGCVTFQVPKNVRVTEVKWTTDSGFGDWAEWKVG